MQQFVYLFRLPRAKLTALTEAERTERTRNNRAWAQQLNAAGHRLSPHIMDIAGHWIGPNGVDGPDPAAGPDAEVTAAIVFLEACDFDKAVQLARTHPGLQYGASVEVHPWAPPGPLLPSGQ